MLKVDITKTIDYFQLNATFEVGSGITGIIGPSGCGKSLTLHCIAGLQKPDQGEILLNSRPLYQSKDYVNIKAQDRNIGYVFQNYALFPHLTVEKNIEYGLKGKKTQEKKDIVAGMIKKVQLTGYEKHFPSQLSGGQQQRVALARTLITEPDLLLLDEPFSALDYHVKHILEQELLRIIKENYSGVVLLVTHNMEEAYRLCDRLIVYNNGKIVQSGVKEEVFKKPINTAAARVIGCKNILPIESLVETKDHLICTIHGIQLIVPSQPVSKKITHIGIYSEDIHFIEKYTESENSFYYEIIDVIKGIHQSSVTLNLNNFFSIDATISNNLLNTYLHGDFKVKLSPNHLFLLEDNNR